jgi:AraC-like DNA-binding protein
MEASVHVGQTFEERLPAPGAAALVACTWIQHVAAREPPYLHRTVPNGCIELSYALGAEQVYVSGPRREPVVDRLNPGDTVVGIRFLPGAASHALGLPAFELRGLTVTLTSTWGKRASLLAEQLAHADSPIAAAKLLELEVTARPLARREYDPVAAATLDVLRREPRVETSRIAARLFLSDRQLRRRCQAAFGYGAKTMQRVLRFQRFLALNHRHAQSSEDGLGRLAWAAGYADQSHLTRECAALTGLPPTRFLEERTRSCGTSHDHKTMFAPFVPGRIETTLRPTPLR